MVLISITDIQILNYLISQNIEIKGLVFDCEEIKLFQFADDTTLILDGSEESLEAALNTIEIFGTFSGLKMNTTKTKAVWIGRKKNILKIRELLPLN